ncbi:MAG TPA: tRNA epoxyqueuosine(34) reductase QueG [Pyrinomonadaceae bacterium]|nr:tRNA epoxyqueuosine(34) reductase QueG [Pyrinomonadaceae bacterium]
MKLLPDAPCWTPDPYTLILTSVYRSGENYSNPTAFDPAPQAFTQRIRQQARDLGFELVGIVPALAFDEEHERLSEWLARGYQGAMSWMARDPEQRTDPRKIFPAARSVIVVALNYYSPEQHTSNSETGKISRYAWGDDYHQVVGDKLRALLSWIQAQEPDASGKVCVDIQPMLDKAWAARAGLGWIGKHTNLINPELGSWVFIGELLLNLELEYDDKPIEDHCGTCTLCIDACPTAAIVEPYVVDSNKCISYATIELRDPEIPSAIAEHLEGWLYGCDVCQDVCPWNRFAQPTTEHSFAPRAGNINTDLAAVLELDADSYRERFRNSAMKRAKLSGLQRNARALLNSTNSDALKK